MEKEYNELVIKAARLAESVLMDWDIDDQVELAKDVAILTHILIEKDTPSDDEIVVEELERIEKDPILFKEFTKGLLDF